MDFNMKLPFEIKKKYWIVRRVLKKVGMEKTYVRKEKYFEEYSEFPIYKQTWIKEEAYLKSCTLDEDGWGFEFSDNQWLEEPIIHLYAKEVYIFDNEEDADNKLIKLEE